ILKPSHGGSDANQLGDDK
nr:21 kda differentiation protein/superoxide dismutase homolog {N-terminal} {EC 1.15.1.1} [Uromyces appendiculatus=bean rust funguses, Germlings, urediospore germ tube, Peptide Partial, 18 aa] [Uromyces appendiculatus]